MDARYWWLTEVARRLDRGIRIPRGSKCLIRIEGDVEMYTNGPPIIMAEGDGLTIQIVGGVLSRGPM